MHTKAAVCKGHLCALGLSRAKLKQTGYMKIYFCMGKKREIQNNSPSTEFQNDAWQSTATS